MGQDTIPSTQRQFDLATLADDRTALFTRLDAEIRECLAQFVRCGRALKEMRDSQAYLEKHATFEEYVKAIEGMTLRESGRLIRDALVYEAIASGQTNLVGPQIPSHVRALANAAVFEERVEVREKTGGGKVTIKQPVAVKNAKQLRRIWAKVQKDYEEQCKADEGAGRQARKLTATFIVDRLPDDFKPQHIWQPKVSNTCTALIRTIDKLPKLIESRNLLEGDRLAAIAGREGWTDNDRKQLRDAVREARELLDAIAPAEPAATIIASDVSCQPPGNTEPVISNIGTDNANTLTCPNCKRLVEPDEDGDCPECLHPDIDKVGAQTEAKERARTECPHTLEPRPCTPVDLAIFTAKMKDDLGDIHRALVNVACGAGFQTSDWPAFPDDHPIAASLQAVWEAITAFVKVVNESGIFAEEEADQ